MQKVVNVLAVSSAVVSLAVVGSVGYVYANRTAIIDDIKSQALEAVLGGSGGLGGALGGGASDVLPTGANDLAPAVGPAQASTDVPTTSSPF